MDLAAVLFDAPLLLSCLQVEICEERLEYPPEVRAHIDAIWHEKVIESERAGSRLWDGENYHLLGYSYTEDVLSLRIGLAKYRDVAFRFYPDALVRDMHASRGSAPGIGLFVAGLVETSDGYFVFGRRSRAYLRQGGKISLLGGVLQPDDASVSSAEDLYAWLVRELAEEAGMDARDLSEEYLMGIIRSAKGNTGLVFRVRLSRTRDQAIEDFSAGNDAEMECLEFVRADRVVGELRSLAATDPTMGLYADLLD